MAKAKRRSVSMKKETFDELKKWCTDNDVSMASTVEDAVAAWIDDWDGNLHNTGPGGQPE